MGMASLPVVGDSAAGVSALDAAGCSAAAGAAAELSAGCSFFVHATNSVAARTARTALRLGERTGDCVIAKTPSAGAALLQKPRAECSRLLETAPELVEPLYESAGVGQLRALGEHRLFVEHERKVVELALVRPAIEILHEVVIHVQFEHGFPRRCLL